MKINFLQIKSTSRYLLISWLFALAMMLTATSVHAQPKSYPYKITTTTGMVNDIVKQVAGQRATTHNIIGEGIDPHLFKPTRSNVVELMSADVIFYSGLMLEGKMADILVKVSRRGKFVFAVTEQLDEKTLLEPPEFLGHFDPHVWMDANSWSQAVTAVADALSEYDPSGETVYHSHAEQYRQQLKKLDDYVKKVIGSIPEKRRVLITAHDAFNYFGRAYGIEVLGIQGISTESEAGIQDINRLVDLIVQRDIQAVFVETSVADRNIRALIEGAQSRNQKVIIGGTLFSDAMGQPGTYEGTYIGMIDHNATIIARALGGHTPHKGMQGKLSISK